jgi:hypothetical protein
MIDVRAPVGLVLLLACEVGEGAAAKLGLLRITLAAKLQ